MHLDPWRQGGQGSFALLSEPLLEGLRHYWYRFRPGDWLFPRRDGRAPIDPSSIQKMWTQAKRRAGVTKRCGIHSLRHAFLPRDGLIPREDRRSGAGATHLLEAGTDIVTVQRLLGHGSIRTTMRYLHLARGHLLASASPLDLLSARESEPEC